MEERTCLRIGFAGMRKKTGEIAGKKKDILEMAKLVVAVETRHPRSLRTWEEETPETSRVRRKQKNILGQKENLLVVSLDTEMKELCQNTTSRSRNRVS